MRALMDHAATLQRVHAIGRKLGQRVCRRRDTVRLRFADLAKQGRHLAGDLVDLHDQERVGGKPLSQLALRWPARSSTDASRVRRCRQ